MVNDIFRDQHSVKERVTFWIHKNIKDLIHEIYKYVTDEFHNIEK